MSLLSRTYQRLLSERWRASFGALLGMGLCAMFLHSVTPGNHWMLAPLAATLVIVYVQPHSPVAQPWPVIGSYLFCSLAGWVCAQWVAPVQLGAALALALGIWLMVRFHCIHPPGAGMALLMVLDGPQSGDATMHLAAQVGMNVGIVMLSTMLVSKLVLRRPYPYTAEAAPVSRHHTKDAPPMRRIGLVHADLASAIHTLDTFVDVQEEELVAIYNLAVDHAFGRHVGLTCADIMSRDVITAHFATLVAQMADNGLPHIPVVDAQRKVVGMVTQSDMLAALYKRMAMEQAVAAV